MAEPVLTLAHTPDSDDAFMFHAIFDGKIDCRGLRFENVVEDIETLNQAAEKEKYDVTALSLHGLVYVSDRYLCMRPGASVGDGYGPTLVAPKPMGPKDLKGKRIAIPGERTTATLLLKLFMPGCQVVVRNFTDVVDTLNAGDADVGLLIHEGQITYGDLGLHMVQDLGKWWKEQTGLPAVLGVNAIRRGLDPDVRARAGEVLKVSVDYSLRNQEQAMVSAKRYGRDMEDAQISRFVRMYVNDFTLDLGEQGMKSVETMLHLADEKGLIPHGRQVQFA